MKKYLDAGLYTGAVLTDLSKASGCLPHCLLICKLSAYGVNEKSCRLLASYFSDRSQRVKIRDNVSEWLTLTKGAPQGSLMGPFAYNIFINDLLLQVARNSEGNIYNYADDNTVSACDKTIDGLHNKLTEVQVYFYSGLQKIICRQMPLNFIILCLGLPTKYPAIAYYIYRESI